MANKILKRVDIEGTPAYEVQTDNGKVFTVREKDLGQYGLGGSSNTSVPTQGNATAGKVGLTIEDVNSLYKKNYGITDDKQAQAWVDWANENQIFDVEGLTPHFTKAVNDDLTKRGLDDVSKIKGATSQEFLSNYQTLIEAGVSPQQAYERTKAEIQERHPAVESAEDKAARYEKEFGEALNPENIEKYTGIVKQMYDPEFNKQAKNIAEQYAGMGRDYKGDAYNRAMAGLGGEYQSKAFGDAINLIQQGVQNKATGAGLGLDYTKLGTGTAMANRQTDYNSLMNLINRDWENQDYNEQATLAKELARMQSGNKTPDWAYLLQPLATIGSKLI